MTTRNNIVLVSRDGAIAVVTLNNPRKLNALGHGEAVEDIHAWLAGAPIRVLNAG